MTKGKGENALIQQWATTGKLPLALHSRDGLPNYSRIGKLRKQYGDIYPAILQPWEDD